MRHPRSARGGFSLVELIISMAVTSLVMVGVVSAVQGALRAQTGVKQVTAMNGNLRVGMDLIVRDLIQAGQGLPAGLVVTVASGGGAQPIRRPGPAGTNLTFDTPSGTISAVTVGPGLGPAIDGMPTDMITVLAADNAFDEVRLTALTETSMTVDGAVNISGLPDNPGDNIRIGDLILFEKASVNALKLVTSVNGQVVRFEEGDALNLNQRTVPDGSMAEYIASAPAETLSGGFLPTRVTRVRLISYYVDTSDNGVRDLRLIRRINANPPTTVAFFIEDFRITYDLVDGITNPADVVMDAADRNGTGACDPDPGSAPVLTCTENQIRKVNVTLAGRSAEPDHGSRTFFRNTLSTQVSLRSLALVNRYR